MYLLFDIGGTNSKAAVSEDGKSLKNIKKIPTPPNFNQGILALKQLAGEVSAGQTITTVVAGVAGPLDSQKTMLVSSPHIGGWVNKPLKKSLEEIFKIPVALEHEADLEGVGEAAFGAGSGYKIAANLVVGTGIATTRIIDGKIDQNTYGFEAGHQIIVPNGSPCDCGGRGHLESYVSGSGILKIYGKKGEEIDDPDIWDQMAKYLAIGLNNVAVFWSPEVIILGGAVMQSISMEAVISYYKQYLKIFPAAPKIIPAKLEDAALYGGLKFCLDN